MSKFKAEKKERYNVSLRPSVHKKAVNKASCSGVSLSTFIESLLVKFFCKNK